MDVLQKQVRRARRRLMLDRFIGRLGWCWFLALLIATLAIVARKFWTLGVDGQLWSWAWLGGSLAAGLLAAAVWTFYRRHSPLEAAIEIDRRFGLKERVSSSLALSPAEVDTEAGQALISDAIGRVGKLEIDDAFVVRPNRRLLLPFGPAAAALALLLFVGDKGPDQIATAKTTAENTQQIRKPAEALEKKLEQRQREAQQKGLAEAADIFKNIKQGTKELTKEDNVDRKKALIKLNDLANDMQNRREKLAADDKLKQQFQQLKDLQKGPADKIGQALKTGDFKEAVKEVDKLKEQLAKNQLNEQEKQKLAEQLEQMQKTLDKIVAANQQAKQDLERQLQQARKAGQTEQAQKLQQQLDKLAQQMPKAQKMADMAKQLAKAADGLKKGDARDAQQALAQLADEMQNMQQAADEMAMLDDALEELADAKNSMGCKNCNGEGCAACQGQGQKQGNKPGMGLGKGRGAGPRPEKENKTGFYDSNVRQNVGKGGAVVTGELDGQNRRGEVREEIKASMEASNREAADPLAGQRLPREYREHAKTYFDAVRSGKN